MRKFLTNFKFNICLVLALFSVCFFTLGANAFGVYAKADYSSLVPNEREYFNLSSPIDAIADDNVLAVVQGGNSQTLLIHTDGQFKTLDGINLKQVKKLNDTTLIVSDSGQIKKVDVTTLTQARFDYDQPTNNFGGTFFDLNSEYLITSYSTQLDVYTLSADQITGRLLQEGIPIAQDAPVAINQDNYIFYVVKEGTSFSIYKRLLTSEEEPSIVNTVGTKPTSLIANNEYVYFIAGNQITSVNINDGYVQRLLTDGNPLYDLGYITDQDAPANLSFKGDNLLVTDSINQTVEEYSVVDGKLVFTGFAVAQDKTAFNRIQKDAFAIAMHGDKVAVLDSYKTTVINTDQTYDYYSSLSYNNYIHSQNAPSLVAVGKKVLLGFTEDNTVKFADTEQSYSFGENNVKDVCYQNEYYYVLTDNGSQTTIFKAPDTNPANASELEFVEALSIPEVHALIFTVDVFGNIYCYNDFNLYLNGQPIIAYSGISKLGTDLVGNLFAISNDSFIWYNQTSNKFETIKTLGEKIVSFTMDYAFNNVYFLLNSSEFVYYTLDLNNVYINGIKIPDTFVTTGEQATLSSLAIHSVEKGQNVYKVSTNDTFNYLGLTATEEEYIKICETNLTGINGDNNFAVMLSKAGITLVNSIHAKVEQVTLQSAPTVVYATTEVNAYYLPVLTSSADYSIVTDGNKLRLEKGASIAPKITISFLGVDYYFATVKGGINAFIPTNFTVETLSKDYISNSYTIETVKKTPIYADQDLTVEIGSLNKGDKVKVLDQEEDSSSVAIYVESGGNVIIAYIPKTAIANPASTAIRNILIILAILACASGSTTFFLLRKKRK